MLVLWQEEANIYINLANNLVWIAKCKVQGSTASYPAPSGLPHQSCVVCGWAFVSLADIDPAQVRLSHGLPSHVGNHGEQATDTQRLQRLESMREVCYQQARNASLRRPAKKDQRERTPAGRPAWNKAMTMSSSCCLLQLSSSSHLTWHAWQTTSNLWAKSCLSIDVCRACKLWSNFICVVSPG